MASWLYRRWHDPAKEKSVEIGRWPQFSRGGKTVYQYEGELPPGIYRSFNEVGVAFYMDKAGNVVQLTDYPIPSGWRKDTSKSRPGEVKYENSKEKAVQYSYPGSLPEGWKATYAKTGSKVYEKYSRADPAKRIDYSTSELLGPKSWVHPNIVKAVVHEEFPDEQILESNSYDDIDMWVVSIAKSKKLSEYLGTGSVQELAFDQSIVPPSINMAGFKRIQSSGNNNDCLIHSILTATSEQFRDLPKQAKDLIATYFRYNILQKLFKAYMDRNPEPDFLASASVTLREIEGHGPIGTEAAGAFGSHFRINIFFKDQDSLVDKNWTYLPTKPSSPNLIIIYNPGQNHYESICDKDGHFIFPVRLIEAWEEEKLREHTAVKRIQDGTVVYVTGEPGKFVVVDARYSGETKNGVQVVERYYVTSDLSFRPQQKNVSILRKEGLEVREYPASSISLEAVAVEPPPISLTGPRAAIQGLDLTPTTAALYDQMKDLTSLTPIQGLDLTPTTAAIYAQMKGGTKRLRKLKKSKTKRARKSRK